MYTVTRRGRNVANVKIPYKGKLDQRFLITADRHWDNPHSNWQMQLNHLRQAQKYNAGIIDIGDLFCAMQGKYDKRANKDSLREEHRCADYFDALVNTASDFFEPYAKSFITLGMGNHESSVSEKHEINLTTRLCKELNQRTGTKLVNGGYSGWVNFIFENEVNKCKTVYKMWYIHGYGGGGPVTRGVIQSNRKAVYLPDANIVVSGHVHEEWEVSVIRLRSKDDGSTYLDEQRHIQVPTYKEEYSDGYGGWHIETGKPPKPTGATWLWFHKLDEKSPLTFDTLRAK